MSGLLYFRINMGSHLRGYPPDEVRNLLLARQQIWNRLVGVFNVHIEHVKSQIALQYPDAYAKLLVSEQESASWYEAIKEVRHYIRESDVDLNVRISKVICEAPIWWQNKDELYADFIRAVRTNKYRLKALRMRTNNGSEGGFNYRFQHPVSINQLLEGTLPLCITQSGRHALLKMPIHASGHGQYITIDVPFTMHRDLCGKKIHGVKLIYRKEGAIRRTIVSFLTSIPAQAEKLANTRPIVASVDVGWRITQNGMRVATACLDGGYFEELILPSAWVLGMDYLWDLDRHLSEGAKEFALTNQLLAPNSWQTITNFEGLWGIWGQQTQSIRNEYRNKQAKLVRERLDIYHRFSARLASSVDTVIMEGLNLQAMQRPTSNQGPEQKRQQRMAAITVLQNTLENACRKRGKRLEKVKAYNSSTIHVDCGYKNKPSRTNDIFCGGCGEHYDQDRNAALMLAKNYLTSAQVQ